MDIWTDWKTDKVTNHIIDIIMIKINWWIVKCIDVDRSIADTT